MQLSRDLTLLDVTMLGVGALMGGGVFVLLGIAVGVAGPGLLLAFFLNGLVTIPTLMVYAELGSAFHDTGGGYLWIKDAMKQPWGFLGGWMGWFSHAVACAVYTYASAYFLKWLLDYLQWTPGLLASAGSLKAIGIGFALMFLLLNYFGVKQSIRTENAINAFVLVLVVVFLGFGVWRLAHAPALLQSNFADFLPQGMEGVFLAMGITFISFEGYEIISQSSEEVQDPKRTIPRAIWYSLLIVWAVILVTTVVALGLVPTENAPAWRFLGAQGPLALVEAARFVMPYGSLVILASAMLLQLVALNATIYSSSRVSFAMARDGNLPRWFSGVHKRYRTPHRSVLASGVIIVVVVALLPIESIATAADVMFLLLFLLVNAAYLKLRHSLPREAVGYRAPFFPWLPLIGIATKGFLAIYLYKYSPVAWWATASWIVVGLAFFYVHVSPHERRRAQEARAVAVPHEAGPEPRKDFRVLVPLSNPRNVRGLSLAARDIARGLDGEVAFLYVVLLPPATPLSEGHRFIADAHALFREAEAAVGPGVPTRTIVRIGHDVSKAIRETVAERGTSLLLMGWRGRRRLADFIRGTSIDDVVEDPPCNVGILKIRGTPPPTKILAPTRGGAHASLSMRIAAGIARSRSARLTLINVVGPHEEISDEGRNARARALLKEVGAEDVAPEVFLERGRDPVRRIVDRSEGYDLVVLGASTEPVWRSYLFGEKPERIAEGVHGSVLVIKTHVEEGRVVRRLRRYARTFRRLLRAGA